MRHRYLAVLTNNDGTVHVEDGHRVDNFPSMGAFATAIHAPPSTQPMMGIFNALGATGWQRVGLDREQNGGSYIFSLSY
ncbi:hypothetical protein DEFR109230_07460 [Deinococcus frigens]